MAKSIPKTILGRTSKLLMSGAKIAAQEAIGRLQGSDSLLATKLRQTEELVTTLSQLKGAAMKAGQIASLEFSEFLPPEVLEKLRELHDQSSYMAIDQVRFILSRELGKDALSDLESLSELPIASASIGQVHRATLNGKEVVVKVQFPGIAETIDADIGALRKLASLWLKTQGHAIRMDDFFTALADGLKKEADYRLEAQNIAMYQAAMHHADANAMFVIPTVYPKYSTGKVITLSFEEGVRLNDWIKSTPTVQDRDEFATIITHLLVTELLITGVMQTDPNFGNFLYRPNERKLVLLDFGATEVYPVDFRRNLQAMLEHAIKGNYDALLELVFTEGLLDRRESKETTDLVQGVISHVVAIMDPANQPFSYKNPVWIAEFREIVLQLVKSVRYTPPSQRFAFLNRKLGGMYHLLKELDAKVDMRTFYEKIHQNISYTPPESRVEPNIKDS